MGDALAVEIAQQSHYNLLHVLAGCMQPDEVMQYRKPCPRGPFFELLTIDDHIGLQVVKKNHDPVLERTRDQEVFERAEAAYQQVKLTAHPGKRQRQVHHATVLGAEIDGREGRVSAPRGRIAVLCYITSLIICKKVITRKILEALIGCWTHICLFRRPSFAVLDKVYNEGKHFDPNRLFHMSSQAINELTTLCVLAPTLQTNLKATTAPALFMMDASPHGGGICRANLPEAAVAEFWRHTERRGYYTCLQQGPNKLLHELGLEHEEFFGLEVEGPSPEEHDCKLGVPGTLRDATVIYDCIELFSGFGNWSRAHAAEGLHVHPGVERDARGAAFGDLGSKETFLNIAKSAYSGAVLSQSGTPGHRAGRSAPFVDLV